MTKEEAKTLKRFDNHCTCGGYAWSMNGRSESNPHMSWCPQKSQYDEWYATLHDNRIGEEKMVYRKREHLLEEIIVDLTDGTLRRWYDIQAATGLSEERCKELEKEITNVFKKYRERKFS